MTNEQNSPFWFWLMRTMTDEERRMWANAHAIEALAETVEAEGKDARELRRVVTNLGEVALEVGKRGAK